MQIKQTNKKSLMQWVFLAALKSPERISKLPKPRPRCQTNYIRISGVDLHVSVFFKASKVIAKCKVFQIKKIYSLTSIYRIHRIEQLFLVLTTYQNHLENFETRVT